MSSLPSHVRLKPDAAPRVDDGLWYPRGHLFPEDREELWPHRSFPLREGELEEGEETIAEEIVLLGLQFSIFVQHHRDPAYEVKASASASRDQALWTDLEVFDEEPCRWHYPRLQVGYNVDRVTSPELLSPDQNQPRVLGFMPNGDLMARWELAEALSDAFGLDISAIPSSIDGRHLVAVRDASSEALAMVGRGRVCEAGLLFDRREAPLAVKTASELLASGVEACHYAPNPSGATFYRLEIPTFQCEARMNRWGEGSFGEVDVRFPRLVGHRFQIRDHPSTREQPLFATERGQLIISRRFHGALSALHREHGGRRPPGVLTAVARTP